MNEIRITYPVDMLNGTTIFYINGDSGELEMYNPMTGVKYKDKVDFYQAENIFNSMSEYYKNQTNGVMSCDTKMGNRLIIQMQYNPISPGFIALKLEVFVIDPVLREHIFRINTSEYKYKVTVNNVDLTSDDMANIGATPNTGYTTTVTGSEDNINDTVKLEDDSTEFTFTPDTTVKDL